MVWTLVTLKLTVYKWEWENKLGAFSCVYVFLYTICSSFLPSFWLGFCWLLDKGGVVDEHVFMFGGVDVVGEFPEQPTPLTECWYIIESPGKYKYGLV